MVFSNLLFLTLFLPVTIALYYAFPEKAKNVLLLIVSLVFYAWGEPVYVFLMLITTLYIWCFGLLIEKSNKQKKKLLAKRLLILCLIFSLGTLAYYKYADFIIENISLVIPIRNTAPALPIGISFYTFQALSYAIDVYRGDVKAQRSYINFAMYISLFPQLIAGPIVRYADIEHQLVHRKHSYKNMYLGIRRFTVGLCKKVLFANQIGLLWDAISASSSLSVLDAWLGAVAFALQIYFDFSAYSDMAIGLGKMFGFDFTENFLYPYQSNSITDFWRRWHITLGTWFREYAYIPLGGNRKGKFRLLLNLFIVWSLTGLWHGAGWLFLLWGIYYFLFLTIEKVFLLKRMDRWPTILRRLYTLLIVVIGWVMFACTDLGSAGSFYKAMFGIGVPLVDKTAIFLLSSNALLLLALFFGSTAWPKRALAAFRKYLRPAHFEVCIYVCCILLLWLCIAFLVADTYNPFLYFRF